MGEPHPFSFSQIGPNGALRVSIKALGDYTSQLPSKLEVGQVVRVQGPFGRFKQNTSVPQIWIAGGIGITPFLAWAEALDPSAQSVDLFYCIRSTNDAPHLDEIKRLAAEKTNLNLHVMDSGAGRRMTSAVVVETAGDDLSKLRVSFCGPVRMRETLQRDLRRAGLKSNRFHYEEFEFRTGIGLKKLADWVLSRR